MPSSIRRSTHLLHPDVTSKALSGSVQRSTGNMGGSIRRSVGHMGDAVSVGTEAGQVFVTTAKFRSTTVAIKKFRNPKMTITREILVEMTHVSHHRTAVYKYLCLD